MFGLLNIRKPAGPTSHDVVDGVRRLVGRRIKVGHAGTLDPFAEGVLVVCVGPATRLADFVQAQTKTYAATFLLGATSSTDDPEGEIAVADGASAPPESIVREAVEKFVGRIEQVPPAHSAVHVQGRRAFELARVGRSLALAARAVTVYRIDVRRYAYPLLDIEVTCGSGTYIRALARDIGGALGVGGYCSRLVRTAVGVFRIEQAAALDDLDIARDLLDPLLAVEALPKVRVGAQEAADIRAGRFIPSQVQAEQLAIIGPDGKLLALAAPAREPGRLRPVKVFPPEQPPTR
jgi:tRNA pseudouridine55 synthase